MTNPCPLLFVLSALAIVGTNSGCTRESRVNRHLSAAEKSYRAERYEEAEIESKNALQMDSLNSQAIGILGLIYAQEGRIGASLPYLLRAREQQPDNVDVALQLALANLALGKLTDAETLANFVLSKRPGDLQAPLVLADTARTPAAIATVQQRLSSLTTPANRATVATAKGLLELRSQNVAAAKSDFDAALAADPKSADAFAGLSLLYLSTGKPDDAARAFASAAENAAPRSPRKIQYARFLLQRGDMAAARTSLNATLKAAPDYMPALLLLAEIDLSEKKYDAAQTGLTEALRRDPSNLDATVLDSQLKLARGQPEPAIAELEKIMSFYPGAPVLSYQLGVAYDAAGQTGKALVSVNRTLKADPDYLQAALLQARLQIKQGSSAVAVSSLEKLLQRRPEVFEAWLLLAETLVQQGDFLRALSVTASAEQKFPGQIPIRFVQARANLGAGKMDAARADLSAIHAQVPNFFPAVEALFNLELKEQKIGAAKQLAAAEVRERPEQLLNVVLLARAYAAEKDYKGGEKALNDALATHPDSLELLDASADLQLSANHPDQAQALLERIVAQKAKDPLPLMRLAMLQEQRGQYDQARASYEKVLVINPGFSSALNNLAYLYSERFNDLDRALVAAEKARSLLPGDPSTADTLGWILVRKRQLPRARGLLQESASNLSSTPEIAYHLGVVKYLLGEEVEAARLLTSSLNAAATAPWSQDANRRLKVLGTKLEGLTEADATYLQGVLSVEPDDAAAGRRLASYYNAQNLPSKAVEVLERIVRTNPANSEVAAMLAREYLRVNQPAKALELAKTAHDATPSDPEITRLLGWSAYLQGNHLWAATLLDEAATALPDNAGALFQSAVADYSVGKTSEARTAAESAQVKARPPVKAQLSEFLRALKFNDGGSVETNTQEFRSTDDKIPELELVFAMARGKISESKGDLSQALLTYKTIAERFPDFPEVKRRLVVIYSADVKTSREALALAPKARSAFPSDKELAAAIGKAAFLNNDYTLAERELSRSETSAKVNLAYLGLAEVKNGKTVEGNKHLKAALALGLAEPELSQVQQSLSALDTSKK